MAGKPTIAIIGAGNLGSVLAVALHRAGYAIREIVGRDDERARRRNAKLARRLGARAVGLKQAALDADVIWFSVPDGAIAACARAVARGREWTGKTVVHSSGALPASELEPLRRRGARAASAHPLMTFVAGVTPSLAGVPIAMEGDAAATRVVGRIVRDLGGDPFPIRAADKVLYHAWGAFASPLMVALLAVAEEVAARAGLERAAGRKKMLPILQQTWRNYAARGPAASFSGPLVRGDAATVRQHVKALEKVPGAKDVYLALARSALRTLPVRNKAELQRALGTAAGSKKRRARRKA